MALRGYFLQGVKNDNILVFRSEDNEDLLRIIQKLERCRDKDIKELAQCLKDEYYLNDRKK